MSLADARAAARLPAQDLARARTWYRQKLGLEPTETRPGGLLYVMSEGEFALYESAGRSDGSFTQLGFTVLDLNAKIIELKHRGVVFEALDRPGLQTLEDVATIQGNYPSRGRGERAVWFRDSEGNMLGLGQTVI